MVTKLDGGDEIYSGERRLEHPLYSKKEKMMYSQHYMRVVLNVDGRIGRIVILKKPQVKLFTSIKKSNPFFSALGEVVQ